ncbi:MAG: hypothetical protein HUU08_12940 [Candidatus Brocadia sp.]|nr:hypothetical protein [Candidatus Brocadia sp.]
MNDINSAVESYFLAMMKKSGQEWLKMGFTMFNMARRQVIASINNNNPQANSQEIRRKIFFRFYGQEFSPEQ